MDSPDRYSQETVKAIEESSPSQTVVQAVADVAGEDLVELPPLYDTIDPEAMDAFLRGPDSGTLKFKYNGYTVVVDQDITVSVRE